MKMKLLVVLGVILLAAACAKNNSEYSDVPGVDEILKYTGNQGEPIVLVHGNTGYPSHWDRTVSVLKANGWTDAMIFRPSWGSKTCAACNAHTSDNLAPVKTALQQALAKSTTGKIDVMAHSMGVTLAAKAIKDLGYQGKVRTFVGIAGAWRGLLSCGVYPYNVATSTCGSNGLSVGSPILTELKNFNGGRYGTYMHAIYSWVDEVVCSTGACIVYGTHSSIPYSYDGGTAYSVAPYGHFGVLYYTESVQKDYAKKP